jgi:hypothetical protein
VRGDTRRPDPDVELDWRQIGAGEHSAM